MTIWLFAASLVLLSTQMTIVKVPWFKHINGYEYAGLCPFCIHNLITGFRV